jgi:hypothetical protein
LGSCVRSGFHSEISWLLSFSFHLSLRRGLKILAPQSKDKSLRFGSAVSVEGLQCTCSRQLMAIATSRTHAIQTHSLKSRVKTNTHSRPNVRRACGWAIPGPRVRMSIFLSLSLHLSSHAIFLHSHTDFSHSSAYICM